MFTLNSLLRNSNAATKLKLKTINNDLFIFIKTNASVYSSVVCIFWLSYIYFVFSNLYLLCFCKASVSSTLVCGANFIATKTKIWCFILLFYLFLKGSNRMDFSKLILPSCQNIYSFLHCFHNCASLANSSYKRAVFHSPLYWAGALCLVYLLTFHNC